MLYLDSVSQGLSEENMLNLQTAGVDKSASSSHPCALGLACERRPT